MFISDVTEGAEELDIALYDEAAKDTFMGRVRLLPVLTEDGLAGLSGWHPLEGQSTDEVTLSGEILLSVTFEQSKDNKVGMSDFRILNLIGKGIALLEGYHKH
jgi:hypothetical protein